MSPADSTYRVMSRELAEARDERDRNKHRHGMAVVFGAWMATSDQRFMDLHEAEKALAEEVFDGLPEQRTA